MADPRNPNRLPLDLIDDDRYWEGFVLPPSDFADLRLPDSRSTSEPIMLTAEGERISDAMAGGYEYLLANGAAVRAAVLDAMVDYYVATRKRWTGQLDAHELEALMPPITGPQDLTARMELSGITLHDVVLEEGRTKEGGTEESSRQEGRSEEAARLSGFTLRGPRAHASAQIRRALRALLGGEASHAHRHEPRAARGTAHVAPVDE